MWANLYISYMQLSVSSSSGIQKQHIVLKEYTCFFLLSFILTPVQIIVLTSVSFKLYDRAAQKHLGSQVLCSSELCISGTSVELWWNIIAMCPEMLKYSRVTAEGVCTPAWMPWRDYWF